MTEAGSILLEKLDLQANVNLKKPAGQAMLKLVK
jgi:hypothetical protein